MSMRQNEFPFGLFSVCVLGCFGPLMIKEATDIWQCVDLFSVAPISFPFRLLVNIGPFPRNEGKSGIQHTLKGMQIHLIFLAVGRKTG